MAIVQGNWGLLLSPGLAVAFKNFYFEKSDASIGFKILGNHIEKKTGINFIRMGVAADGCLHVYDLGDGMLVPCQLVDDLFG